MELALCAAPLDVILAEIACEATAFETAQCPHRPMSYVEAVLSTMGGGSQPSLPLALLRSSLTPSALSSSDVEAAIGEQCRQAATARVNALADVTAEHRRSKAAAASAELDLAEVQCFKDALAKETRWRAALAEAKCHEDTLGAHRHLVDAAIERIWTELALCAAPLDAILAEIACKATAFETAPCPHRPTSYVDEVLSTMGGGSQPSLPLALSPSALVPVALPSSDVEAAIGEQRQQAATARVNALADATAEHRRSKAAAASAELNLAEVQCFKDALAKETR